MFGSCLPYNLICFRVQQPYGSVHKERKRLKRKAGDLEEGGFASSCLLVQFVIRMKFTAGSLCDCFSDY